MVDGVLLAIGGSEDSDGSKKTSAIYAFLHVDQKWQHVGDMPFQCTRVDSLLLSGGGLLVVDVSSRHVLEITVEGYSYFSRTVLTRVFSGLAKLFTPSLKEADERCVGHA